MFWSDRIAKQIIDSGKFKPYWVDDMFTPSGFAHIGSLRGPIVHDLVYRSLVHAKQKTTFSYVFNDFDVIDGLPDELQEKFNKYMGFSLRSVPSPVEGYESFAHYFIEDFKNVLATLGIKATFYSSWDMYHEGKFNTAIKEALDNATKIQDIYKKISGSQKKESGWLPLQVTCQNCGRLGTTRVNSWNGKTVEYTCEPSMVTWAQGCGHKGEIDPFNGNGKLPWKVDWPAHWKVLGITIEGAGKDHSSAGGSRDIARELCKDVFHISEPYNLPYEFFLIGGKKMSSSKGLGLKGRDLTKMLPAAVARFLFSRTDYRQAVEFDPMETMAIPDLFDEYDRTWQAYITASDENLARAFELSQINELPNKEPLYLPRFRDITNYIQYPSVDLQKKIEEDKGSNLNETEKKILKEREQYAHIWLDTYAPKEYKVSMLELLPEEAKQLNDEQKKYLKEVITLINRDLTSDELQQELYELAKSQGINIKLAFSGIYLSFIGKMNGPRAGVFLLQYEKSKVIERLEQVTDENIQNNEEVHLFEDVSKDYLQISTELKDKYPSLHVGFAIIKGVNIQKTNSDIQKRIEIFFKEQETLTNEQIGEYPEIKSYRKLYKEMGIDWHSRRPSPEALLRRIAQKKGLYNVNTCVDAYNLIVMKNRVSVGAFDLEKIKLPTELRFAKEQEKILLLGDTEETLLKPTEIVYADQNGAYNTDFNYRDAQRTSVSEETKNLMINVDGVYEISRKEVEQTLQEVISIIIEYCGGTVEVAGIVSTK